FIIRMLENLDRSQAEVVCYSDRPRGDDLTVRLRATTVLWHDTFGWSDNRLAEQVRADGVDILFDLAGHTANNRLLAFARKPAPVQVTWAGYVGTTGLAAMDYLLADPREVPPDADPHYRERVLRMPDAYVSYEPPPYAPPVAPPPAPLKGYVTFGSFSNPVKLNPGAAKVWAEILRRLPDSRLVLKYKGY